MEFGQVATKSGQVENLSTCPLGKCFKKLMSTPDCLFYTMVLYSYASVLQQYLAIDWLKNVRI